MSEDAKRFYLDNIIPYVQTLNRAVDLIEQEHNSTVRQNRVKNVLSNIRLHDKLNGSN